jgi:membrane protein implicated in regulation of membrane protease activity
MIPGFEHVAFWHWWILAGLLLVLQLTSQAFFLLWIGIAAALVGFLLLIIPGLPLEAQLLLFGALSILAVVVSRRYRVP